MKCIQRYANNFQYHEMYICDHFQFFPLLFFFRQLPCPLKSQVMKISDFAISLTDSLVVSQKFLFSPTNCLSNNPHLTHKFPRPTNSVNLHLIYQMIKI